MPKFRKKPNIIRCLRWAKGIVKTKYPRAFSRQLETGEWRIYCNPLHSHIGIGYSELEAWNDAAKELIGGK